MTEEELKHELQIALKEEEALQILAGKQARYHDDFEKAKQGCFEDTPAQVENIRCLELKAEAILIDWDQPESFGYPIL